MDVKILQDTAMADVVAVLATTTAVCGLSFCSAAAAADAATAAACLADAATIAACGSSFCFSAAADAVTDADVDANPVSKN